MQPRSGQNRPTDTIYAAQTAQLWLYWATGAENHRRANAPQRNAGTNPTIDSAPAEGNAGRMSRDRGGSAGGVNMEQEYAMNQESGDWASTMKLLKKESSMG